MPVKIKKMNTLEDIRDELKALPNDLEGAEEEFTIHALLGAIGFAVDQESPLSDVLKRRKIPSTTQSKDGLEFMQQRLLECTSHHGH
ncbi:hypothetical protein H9L39_09946 [Fusarium oxysporum f. sp. albedinis]|nr:hypothetical protein H9L39_09946 [Fusarium oxysporum f. sp. albedinis]